MNNYTNNEPKDPHGFKEQVKIKYETTKAIARKFPNGAAALMELLSRAQSAALDWDGYCALPANKKIVWEQRADTLNQSMLYLMNSKSKFAKKDLRLAYTLSSSPCISVATGGSKEALSGGGVSISTLGMEKNNCSCNFVDFHPIITGTACGYHPKLLPNSSN